jgi:predicted neuraminidase
VRLLDGTLKAWFRDRDAGFIFTSESNDDGHVWTRPIRTVLPNNNKAIQAIMLTSGNIVRNPPFQTASPLYQAAIDARAGVVDGFLHSRERRASVTRKPACCVSLSHCLSHW